MPIHRAAYQTQLGAVRYFIEQCGQPYDIHVAARWAMRVGELLKKDPSLADAPLAAIG